MVGEILRIRVLGALALAIVVVAAGCGGDDDGPGAVNTEDGEAVSDAFRAIKGDVATLEAAAALGDITTEFEEATGSGPTDVDTGAEEASASLDDNVGLIIDALGDESSEATIATEDDATVAAFLSEVANEIAEVDEGLAAELDRTREALSADADGGPSAGVADETDEPTTTTDTTPTEPENSLERAIPALEKAGFSATTTQFKEAGVTARGAVEATKAGADFTAAEFESPADAERAGGFFLKFSAKNRFPAEVAGNILFYSGKCCVDKGPAPVVPEADYEAFKSAFE